MVHRIPDKCLRLYMEMVTVGRVHLPLSELVSYSELMPGPETGTRITAQEAVT